MARLSLIMNPLIRVSTSTSSSFPTVSEQLRASCHKSIAAGASCWSNVRLNPFLKGDYEEKNPDFRRHFLSGAHDVFARTGSNLRLASRGRETWLGRHQRQHRQSRRKDARGRIFIPARDDSAILWTNDRSHHRRSLPLLRPPERRKQNASGRGEKIDVESRSSQNSERVGQLLQRRDRTAHRRAGRRDREIFRAR